MRICDGLDLASSIMSYSAVSVPSGANACVLLKVFGKTILVETFLVQAKTLRTDSVSETLTRIHV